MEQDEYDTAADGTRFALLVDERGLGERAPVWLKVAGPYYGIAAAVLVVLHLPQTAYSALPHILARKSRLPAHHATEPAGQLTDQCVHRGRAQGSGE